MVYAIYNEMKVGGKETINLDLPPGADHLRIEVEDSTQDDGIFYTGHSKNKALVSGKRVKTEHFPPYMKKRSGSIIPDYGCWNSLIHVSDRFRQVIESIEPGIHQFIPFQIVGSKKVVLADLFFMNICNRLDTVDRENTTLILLVGRLWTNHRDVSTEHWPEGFDPSRPTKLVFNESQVGNHHIWFDKHRDDGPLISNTLADLLQSSGLVGFRVRKLESV